MGLSPTYQQRHDGFPGIEQMLIKQSRGKIDLAILPINGKVGNMTATDAVRLAEAIAAKLVVPCHYDLFQFNTADPAEHFVLECHRLGRAVSTVSFRPTAFRGQPG